MEPSSASVHLMDVSDDATIEANSSRETSPGLSNPDESPSGGLEANSSRETSPGLSNPDEPPSGDLEASNSRRSSPGLSNPDETPSGDLQSFFNRSSLSPLYNCPPLRSPPLANVDFPNVFLEPLSGVAHVKIKLSGSSGPLLHESRIAHGLLRRFILPIDIAGYQMLPTALCIALWCNDAQLLEDVQTADGRFENVQRVSEGRFNAIYVGED